jgi:hypothetical protein
MLLLWFVKMDMVSYAAKKINSTVMLIKFH